MVFRKPYAFLIKHFKIVHLILTLIYIYLALKVNGILKYYNNFISGTESKLNAINYVNNFYILAIVASIIICLIIYALMRYKKKPKLLYVILIVLYLTTAIIINISLNGLNTIYIDVLDVKTQRVYRDLLQIIIIFQYISICFTTVRALGFDIKKFNFQEDIAELEINVTDDEEVELTLGSTSNVQRKGRRILRELKYYYNENKLFINVIICIVVVVLIAIFTIDTKVVNKIYNEGDIVSTEQYKLKVLSTYITDKSYNNEIASGSSDTFIIVKTELSSNSTKSQLNTGNLTLNLNKKTYTTDPTYYNTFKDIGVGYTEQEISTNQTYIFVFNVPKEDINKKPQLNYMNKKIKLSPTNIDKINKKTTKNLNEPIELSETTLDSGNINISEIKINNKFEYYHNYELNNKVYSSKLNITSLNQTILNIKATYNVDLNMSMYDFIKTYGSLKYKVNNQTYESTLMNNKTPTSYSEGLYIEVNKEIEQATDIWLDFIIRDKEYIYKLK